MQSWSARTKVDKAITPSVPYLTLGAKVLTSGPENYNSCYTNSEASQEPSHRHAASRAFNNLAGIDSNMNYSWTNQM